MFASLANTLRHHLGTKTWKAVVGLEAHEDALLLSRKDIDFIEGLDIVPHTYISTERCRWGHGTYSIYTFIVLDRAALAGLMRRVTVEVSVDRSTINRTTFVTGGFSGEDLEQRRSGRGGLADRRWPGKSTESGLYAMINVKWQPYNLVILRLSDKIQT